MAQFTDCLKLAKFIARYEKKSSIDLDAVRKAMAFFEPDAKLKELIGEIPSIPQDQALLDYGKAILDAYDVLPAVPLTDQVKALREKVDAAQRIPERFRSDLALPSDNIKAVRALTTPNFQKTLENYKPSNLESAKRFGEELSAFLDKKLSLRPASTPATPEAEPQEAKTDDTARADTKATGGKAQTPAQPTVPATPPPSPVPGLQLDPGVQQLKAALEAELLDQPLAISELIEELQARAWKLVPKKLPALFMLAGPPASGKNLLASILAKSCPDRPLLKLNMGSMSSRNEGFALTGLRAGYDSAGPGRLTGFVQQNENAIVVLENFDQAHPNVQNLLVPLFTDGTLTDEFGFGKESKTGAPGPQVVSFANALVLLTTSQGSAVYERRDYRKLYDQAPAQVIALLTTEMVQGRWAKARPERADKDEDSVPSSALPPYLGLCRLLPFRQLGMEALYTLTQRSVETFRQNLSANKVELVIEDSAKLNMALTLSMGPDFNPVELQSAAGRVLLPVFMRQASLLASSDGNTQRVFLRVKDNDKGNLATLQKDTPAKVQSDFFRLSKRLSYTLNAAQGADRTVDLTFQVRGIERVPISSDYGRDGGISIDLPQSSFEQIFGHHYIKDRLQEVVRLLKPNAGTDSKAISLPKGMLLHGRPGTGKTMLAKALAAEAGLPFIAVSGPQLLELDLIRQVFRLARKYAPALVFMDEIDALGVRGKGGADPCINQLLTEIDGFEESRDGSVFVIAATNFPAKVDPALTRSGRLDLRLEVPMLDADARRHFLKRLRTLPHVDTLDLDALVEFSAGMSGADLEKLCREATLDTIRNPRERITQAELLELLNVIKHGARVIRPPLKAQLESTAYHEAGHAVVSLVLNPDVRIEQVNIVPRGDALGFTAYNEESMGYRHFNRHEVMDLLCVALAGRTAESKQFPENGALGGPDAGAADDLRRATELAWKAVTEWGLDDEFGWVSTRPWSDETSPSIWQTRAAERVEAWLTEARQRTQQTIVAQWPLIEALAQKLVKEELVDGKALKELAAQHGLGGDHGA